MLVTVEISNEQDDFAIDESGLERIARFVLAAEGTDEDAELSVGIVGEARMTELNEKYAGQSGPTDVLAFAYDEFDEERQQDTEEPVLLGDVVLCPAVAARNAAEYESAVDRELELLLVHGLLHLLGYDHVDTEEEEAMRFRQSELIERFSAGGSQ